MRLLYVAAGMPIPGTHGGSVHALQLCRALSRAGHEVHLACLAPEGADAPHEDAVAAVAGSNAAAATRLDGVTLHRLRRRPRLAQLEWMRASQVLPLAETLQPDIVIERFYTFGGSGLRAAARLDIPAILEVNSPARPYPGSLRDRLDRLTLLRPVDRWRQWQLASVREIYATSSLLLPAEHRGRTTVIVNGVDCERIKPGDAATDTGPLRLVYVSSFRSWHGAEDLIRAVALALQAGADLELVCVGEGPRLQAARRLASKSALGDRVRFLGRVPHDRVPQLLARAHVGVAPFSPQQHRALELGWFWSPIKIFEYLAAGLAVVTADIAELRDLLPGAEARFYPPADATALAAVLGDLAADRAAVRAAGEAARSLAEARYTWDHQAARVGRILERVKPV